MVHTEYKINKFRIGNLNRPELWSPWEYEAISTRANYSLTGNVDRGTTARHPSIGTLAQELATFPGVNSAEFTSLYDRPEVSLGESASTQRAIVTDEELGELAMLILRYTNKNGYRNKN